MSEVIITVKDIKDGDEEESLWMGAIEFEMKAQST